MEFKDIKKMLFLRYDGKLGDYIVTSWVYREIKRQRPDIQIDVVGISKNEKLFLNNKSIDKFYKLKKSKKLFMYFLAKKLRVEDYDVLIDPAEVLRNRDLFFIKNINAKINFGYDKGNVNLFSKSINKNSKTMVDVYKEILENLGFCNLDSNYEVPINVSSEKKIDEYLKSNRIDKYIAMNFFGAGKRRKFTPKKATELIVKVRNEYPEHKIIILNSPKDKKALFKIIKRIKCLDSNSNIFYNEDFKTIYDAISLINKSDIVITPDTAVVHIAKGLKKNIIAFYSENKENYEKWGLSIDEKKNRIYFYNENINNLNINQMDSFLEN